MDLSELLSMMNSWNQLPSTYGGGTGGDYGGGNLPPIQNPQADIISTIQNMLNNMPPQVFQQTSPPPPPPPPAGPADNSFLRSILNQQGADQSSIPALQSYPQNVGTGLSAQQAQGQGSDQQQKPPYVPMQFVPGGGGTANWAMAQQGFQTDPLTMYPFGPGAGAGQSTSGPFGDIWHATNAASPPTQNQTTNPQTTPQVGK